MPIHRSKLFFAKLIDKSNAKKSNRCRKMKMHSLEYFGIDSKSFAVSSAMWANGYREYWSNCGWRDVEVYQCETFTVYKRRSPIDQRLVVEVTQFEMNVNALIARAFAHHVAPSVDSWETYVGRSCTALRQEFADACGVAGGVEENSCGVAGGVTDQPLANTSD